MLKLDGITIQFGGLTALKDVSFSMGTDQVVGLVGPNGAGKTTLFNAISGLVKPTHGKVEFNGVELGRKPLYTRARVGIGRTFQIPQPMHELTVRENLVVAQRFGHGKVDQRRIDEILAFMDLSAQAGRDAASGLALQELKRLEVAKALATEPRLLLLDEVLAGLETNGKRYFTAKLAELHKAFKIGILIIEHDIETVSTLCDRVVVLNFGRLIADGTPDAVFRDPEVIRSYTGEPGAVHA
ncbi:ABC transporter ATP-binding protein [Noviherbaspirillum galbum]|uniref:ABC transporter ATP-binding protein n=1 Tax=Noviherbaspirillum galbum TaxID=2709383 RepID=A0A6B3SJ75_9BURK|nr:ABC transporter ATP-binding protein [Noviherbaspirillum galbum]NEX60773.1 ABC transporter ATP-binding protein [Noviherbaspirillum galbum]